MKLPQKSIKIDVDFYDDYQRQKLLAYSSADRIIEVVKHGIDISSQEFLTYYLFHKKRPGKPGYQNYESLGSKIGSAVTELEEWVRFNKTSISVPKDAAPQDQTITERVGESIGLAVVNRIHGLTEADWEKLDEIRGRHGKPSFDYEHEIASDGKKIIQIETKGSCVEDNTLKPSTVSNHKTNINKKKFRIRTYEKAADYRYPADLRYGTIAVLDYRPNSIARCWLIDPEPTLTGMPPEQLRLINRMSFLRDWITFISPRSQFAAALSTRFTDLNTINNPMDLDGIPLRKGNGEEIEVDALVKWGQSSSPLFINKSRVNDGPSIGVVMQASPEALVYLGIRSDLVHVAGKQDFGAIINSQYEVGTTQKSIDCVVSETRFRRFKLTSRISEQARRYGNYYSFSLSGQMYYNREGLVFGLLPISPETT